MLNPSPETNAARFPRRTLARLLQSPWLAVVILWLGWWLILNVFQIAAFARLEPARPDRAYAWSATLTSNPPPASNPVKLHVRWDSGFYVAIALYGYEGVNAAFFPLYPMVMKTVDAVLLRPILPTMDEIDRMELAGYTVSSIASLAAALGLFALMRLVLGEEAARRGVFYFLIYPSAIFLLQVYSEPLFLALATWCIYIVIRRRWWVAGLIAGIATLDRAAGITLTIPILVTWLLDWYHGARPRWITLSVVAIPVIVWRLYYLWLDVRGLSVVKGQAYFGRSLFPSNPLKLFGDELGFVTNNPQATVHITLDILLMLLAVGASIYALRKWPAVGVYGLAAIGLPLLTFRVTGLSRYSLAVIPIYFMLATLGRSRVFDRLWTIASLLLMGLYLLLFAHGFWVS